METRIAEDLYDQAMTINQQAFEAGFYNAAYHALMSALYLAEQIPSDDLLTKISLVAQKQLEWIDQQHPEYEHSSYSAAKRNQPASIFTTLSRQAETILKMRTTRQMLDNSGEGE